MNTATEILVDDGPSTVISGKTSPPGHEAVIEISVVVPVYNSALTLDELVKRLHAVMSRLGKSYELIFVDDGSRDDSWRVLQRLQESDPQQVTVVQLMRNFGQSNTLMCGFRQSRGRYVVTIDDDLQTPPEEIPKLYDQIRHQDSDVVYGVYVERQQSLWRRAGSWLATRIFQWVFHCDVPITSYRILRREIIDAILSYGLNFTYIDGLIGWHTQRIGQVTVEHHPRKIGKSGYSLGKLFGEALNLLTNFSLAPLQIVSLLGFVSAMAGFLAGAYYLVQFFIAQDSVPGYASNIVASLVLNGLQLLSLGVLGEYVGRLHLNVNRKPQYTVRQVLSRAARDEGHDRLSLPAQRATAASTLP